jgi:glucose-1-phosphate thymidylyltransferase
VQNRQGFQVACLEEIVWRNGWIDDAQLRIQAQKAGKADYGKFLLSLLR